MTDIDIPTLRISDPAELLTAVPYLLGFHPHDSLVIIGLADSTLVVTARLDLVDADPATLAATIEAIRRGGATSVVGAVFTDTPAAADPVGALLTEQAHLAGLGLQDTLLVSGGRWRSLTCPDAHCCPPDGRPMPTTATVVDATATYAGLTVQPSRDALAARFTPAPGCPDLTAELLQQHEDQLAAALRSDLPTYTRSVVRAVFAAHRAAVDGRMPTDRQAARFAVALQAYPVRDALWLAVDDRRLTGTVLWVNLARRLPRPYDAAPLFLAGWCAFRDGNGAVAGIAAQRAVQSDPGYSAAQLLLAALAHGIDPRTVPRLQLTKGDTEDH